MELAMAKTNITSKNTEVGNKVKVFILDKDLENVYKLVIFLVLKHSINLI